MMSNDIFEEQAAIEAASPDRMQSVASLAEELGDLDTRKDALEEELKAVASALHKLKTQRLPEAMQFANQQEFTVASGPYQGLKIKLTEFASGALEKNDPAKRAAQVAYLESIEGGGLLKDVVTVPIPPSKGNEVHFLISELVTMGFDPRRESDVNTTSLQAFARNRLRTGKPIEGERLGLYLGKAAKPIWPRAKKEAEE